MTTANRKYKDTIFRKYFSDEKNWTYWRTRLIFCTNCRNNRLYLADGVVFYCFRLGDNVSIEKGKEGKIMSRRKMIIRDSVTPDPIDFYIEIKQRKTRSSISALMLKKSVSRQPAEIEASRDLQAVLQEVSV